MVGSRLPSELIRDLEMIERVEQSDRSTTVRKLLYRATKEWKMEYYAKQYAEGKVSTARAAEECGVSLWEMMEYFRQKKIPWQYDLEEWEKDVATVERRVAARNAQMRKPSYRAEGR
jgi:predicted HTH domain antitoxin